MYYHTAARTTHCRSVPVTLLFLPLLSKLLHKTSLGSGAIRVSKTPGFHDVTI